MCPPLTFSLGITFQAISTSVTIDLPLTVKEESSWKSYDDRDYQTELGGPITVAERKEPVSELIVVKEFSRVNTKNRLLILR